jgi:hypothetical protein
MLGSRFNPWPWACAVEVELARFKGLDEHAFPTLTYRVTTDTSVSSGKEMVVFPTVGDDLLVGLYELSDQIVERGCAVDRTCGYHVHIDTSSLSWYDLRRLVLLWVRFSEDIGYTQIFPDRRDNEHARRLSLWPHWPAFSQALWEASDSQAIKRVFLRYIYGFDSSTMIGKGSGARFSSGFQNYQAYKRSKYLLDDRNRHSLTNIRYYDLNLHSHFYRGSVEFRAHHGTVNPTEIIMWPMLCLNLVSLATRLYDSRVTTLSGGEIFSLLHPNVINAYTLLGVRP